MELLIVHRDPEMGPALVQMIRNYTPHQCHLALSDSAALEWSRLHRKCDLLLTQVEETAIHGLSLGSSLSEMFSTLQVLFFPSYPAAARRLAVAQTKVFPEPVEGDDLLGAIERAEKVSDGPDLFDVVDVLQMCCLSGLNGAIQLVRSGSSGLIFIRNGKILHAETASNRGLDAISEMVGWEQAEFAYERSVRPPLQTITSPWDEVLAGARQNEKARSQQRSA